MGRTKKGFMKRDCESPREEKGAEGRAVGAKALGWKWIPLAERKNSEQMWTVAELEFQALEGAWCGSAMTAVEVWALFQTWAFILDVMGCGLLDHVG